MTETTLWKGDRLDPDRFEPDLFGALGNFEEATAAALLTGCDRIAPTHLLIALTRKGTGYTAELWREQKLPPEIVADTLESVVRAPRGKTTLLSGFRPDTVSESLAEALGSLQALLEETGRPRAAEPHVLWATLRHLEAPSREALARGEVDSVRMADLVHRRDIAPPPTRFDAVFAGDEGTLDLAAFDPAARRLLKSLQASAEGLGFDRIGSTLVLLAALDVEKGLLAAGLMAQLKNPRRIHEQVLAHLRAGRRAGRTRLPLARPLLHLSVQQLVEGAARQAAREEADAVGESHLIQGLLSGAEASPRRILERLDVNVEDLVRFARDYASVAETRAKEQDARVPIEGIAAAFKERLVGQDQVIERILPLIKRVRFGYMREGKPAGVFLFMGKSGTGKTQMAKALARVVYGSETDLLFLEMAQFATEHSMSMFIGAPPGYVGYGEGKLTNGLRDNPECVVLFDEVEKAHRDVYQVLLRFLDEGRIDDPAGPTRDASRCLIVLTSNKGSDILDDLSESQTQSKDPKDRAQLQQRLRAEIAGFFRPEFINRIDEIILFNALTREDYGEIVRRQLTEDVRRLREEKQVHVESPGDLVALLTECCYRRRDEGARVVSKEITNRFLNPLIDFVCARPSDGPIHVAVESRGERLEFSTAGGP